MTVKFTIKNILRIVLFLVGLVIGFIGASKFGSFLGPVEGPAISSIAFGFFLFFWGIISLGNLE